MERAKLIDKFSKIPTERIVYGIENRLYVGRDKEIGLIILRKRGKDISKYLDEVPSLKKVSKAKAMHLKSLVADILDSDDKAQISNLYSLVGDIEDLENIPTETADFLIGEIKMMSAQVRTERRVQDTIVRRAMEKDRYYKMAECTKEQKKAYEKYIYDRTLSKKRKIVRMYRAGMSKAQICNVGFASSRYIYRVLAKYDNENNR